MGDYLVPVNVIAGAGQPQHSDASPIVTHVQHLRVALGAPDSSRPISKPSVIPRSAITSRRSCSRVFTVTAPVTLASDRRKSDRSVITTLRAPACLAIAAHITPIGPAPVTSTSSAVRGNCRAVCTALPKGSNKAPRSGSMWSACSHTLPAGTTT